MINSLRAPLSSSFQIFGFDIYYYGIILALAILAGVFAAHKIYKKFYGENGLFFIYDYSAYLILAGIIGARFYYCVVNLPYYIHHPLEVFYIRQGGLSVHGMIIFGIAALYALARYKKVSFLKLADVYLCASLLAQSIGRWGNFFNNEAFGYPSNIFCKLYIPIAYRPEEFINYEYFHPAFLYESLLDLLGFFIILSLFKPLSKKSGLVGCTYLVIYSTIRIFVESFRIDSALNISGFPIAQIVSLLLLLTGICGFIVLNKK